jgi:predicted tellurium resistance membrane protein TerC
MDAILPLLTNPAAWAALLTLIVMEVVLGIDNLIFISVLTNKLPESQRATARRLGIAGAVVLRLAMLSLITIIIQLTTPAFSAFGQEFTWKDLIMIAGGLFLVWKATQEIHEKVDPDPAPTIFQTKVASLTMGAAVIQILILDLVFSVDSLLTAVGMTKDVPVMVAAILISVAAMMVAAGPLARFINANPSVLMLALGFLLLIGMVLIAEGFGMHVPKGYIYAAMAFSALIEGLNLMSKRAKARRAGAAASP